MGRPAYLADCRAPSMGCRYTAGGTSTASRITASIA